MKKNRESVSWWSRVRFSWKLFVFYGLLCLIGVIATGTLSIRLAKTGMYDVGEIGLESNVQSMKKFLTMYDQEVSDKLRSDLAVMQQILKNYGGLYVDKDNTVEARIVNQVTKSQSSIDLPMLFAGDKTLTFDEEIVDLLQSQIGGTATIFHVLDDKLLRVSTNVKKLNGERATGTYIPADSPVYQAVMSGKTFTGKAFVVNDWYLTAYMPVRDVHGDISAVIYVGRKMLSDKIRELISNIEISKGYFFVYHEDGGILIHPSIEGKNLYDEDIAPQFRGVTAGVVEYVWKGLDKITFVESIDKWGVRIAAGANKKDIVHGLDKEMIFDVFLVIIGVIAFGGIANVLIMRVVTGPLKKIAAVCKEIGSGDFTVRVEYYANDELGYVADSINRMVDNSREMIADVVNSSQELSDSSQSLAATSEQMFGNADSTACIAEEATENARTISGNMDSVAAAMEQSTTNLNMTATASEEMSATIKEIAESSGQARLATEKAVRSVESSQESVSKLGDNAESIGKITETITEISEQTNLLALNATIEAARAGEAGKGFAVVANEIKELARETAEATNQIKSSIEGIQDQTKTTIADISIISGAIDEVDQVVNGIVTAVEEQSVTTSEIVENVSQASQAIGEINENVATSSQMTTEMSHHVEQVKEHSVDVRTSSENLRQSADYLSGLSDRLKDLVARFKV